MKLPSPTSDSDQDLVARFVAGERAALGILAQRYEVPLLGLARGMLGGDSVAACDAVQSMWVRVIKYANGFHGKSEVKTWLYRILINECRDWRRSRDAARSGVHLRLAHQETLQAPSTIADAGLHAALTKLGDDKREALLLCFHAGITHEIAADILGVPLGTLKSRVYAGLKELRAALGESEADGEVA
jgi:RNA polymerase sigma-70 factor (ECF subfamily)